jgi:tryptophanyl-tRNA synthetase
MSKSYNNTLAIFEDAKAQRKQIMRIATDSRPMDQAKEPNGDTLFDLLKLVASTPEIDEVAAIYRRGGFGYGDIKKRLADAAEAYFATARGKRAELEANPDWVRNVLAEGAERARVVAGKVLSRVQEACGTKRTAKS